MGESNRFICELQAFRNLTDAATNEGCISIIRRTCIVPDKPVVATISLSEKREFGDWEDQPGILKELVPETIYPHLLPFNCDTVLAFSHTVFTRFTFTHLKLPKM